MSRDNSPGLGIPKAGRHTQLFYKAQCNQTRGSRSWAMYRPPPLSCPTQMVCLDYQLLFMSELLYTPCVYPHCRLFLTGCRPIAVFRIPGEVGCPTFGSGTEASPINTRSCGYSCEGLGTV